MLPPNSRDLMPAMLATCIDEMPHLDRLRFKNVQICEEPPGTHPPRSVRPHIPLQPARVPDSGQPLRPGAACPSDPKLPDPQAYRARGKSRPILDKGRCQ